MGLKGYRLWAMGQLIQPEEPHHVARQRGRRRALQAVAAHKLTHLRKHILQPPGDHVSGGAMVETGGAFKRYGACNADSTCTARQ
jgi:hypothetical protein